MPKPISAAESAPPMRVVIVTMDTHLASATERGARGADEGNAGPVDRAARRDRMVGR